MKKFIVLLIIGLNPTFTLFSQNISGTTFRDTTNLDEVVVTGSRIPVSRNWVSSPISIVDRSIIERKNEIALLPVLMQQIPGLFVTTRGVSGYGVSSGSAGGINIRGFSGSSGRILILIDGHPQYATIYGHPIADAYISSDVERVEVSRGAASVLYGSNAMGGAINLITRKVTKDGYHLNLNTSTGSYASHKYMLGNSIKKGRFTGFLGGNYETTKGHRPGSAFNSLSGFSKISYKISDKWNVTGNMSITHFMAENPGTIDSPIFDNWADVTRGMAGISFENSYDKTSGSVNLYHNWGTHRINDGYYEGGTPQPYLFNSTDYMGGMNIFQAISPFTGLTITGGVDTKLYGGNAYRNPETEIYANHISLSEIASYIYVQQNIWRFRLNGGIRLEHHSLYGNEWVPQTGLTFQVTEATNLKFSVSRGFRTPNMRELYMYAVANEELLPERSISYDLSVSQKLLKNKIVSELSLFYTEGDNLIEVVAIDGIRQNRNVGEFSNKGIEFTLSYRILENLSFSCNYSYLHMDKIITGSPRNKLYAEIEYRPGNFIITIGSQLVDKLYLSTGDEAITSNYTLIDSRVEWQTFEWGGIYLEGENLHNKKYATMLGFPMPGIMISGGLSINI